MADYTAGQSPESMNPDNVTTTALPAGTDQGAINTQVSKEGAIPPSAIARPGERNTTLEEENRTKMLASGELTADANEQLAQEKVNLFTYGVENPQFGATVSSEPVREQFQNDVKTVKDELATTQAQQGMLPINQPDYKLYEDYTDEYDKARVENKDIFERTMENIQADFVAREADQRNVTRQSTGFAAKSLARMKAFGRSGSGLSFLQQVDVQNQRELNKLLTQKNSLLIQAAEAAQAKDIELLGKLVTESHAITDQFNLVQKQRFEDAIATNDQLMKQNRFGWESEDRAMGKISTLIESELPLEELSAEEITTLEEQAGLVPGTFEAIYSTNAKALQAKKDKQEIADNIELQTSVADLLSKIPEGQSVDINGQIMRGWKKESDDTWKTTITDNQGNVTGVTYDPVTKSWQSVGLGNIGAADDGWKLETTSDGIYRVNTQTGQAEPVVVQGSYMDPGNIDGFSEWASSMGSITTPFGTSTQHPNNPLGGEASHPGYDIAPPGAVAGQYSVNAFLPPGTTGTVLNVHDIPNDNLYGRYIEIQDSEGRVWKYSHLASVNVQPGDPITANANIGQMGNTGKVFSGSGGDGTHLDLRVKIPDKQLPGSGAKITPAQQELIANTARVKNEIYPAGSDLAMAQELINKQISSGEMVGYDAGDVVAYARQYADTGVKPTAMPNGIFEVVSQLAMDLPKPDGTLVSIQTGIAPSRLGVNQKEAFGAAYNISTNLIPGMKQAWDDIGNKFNIPADPATQSDAERRYLNLRSQAIIQFAQAVSGKAVSDQERANFEKLFPGPGFTVRPGLVGKNIDEFQKTIQGTITSNLKINGLKIIGFGDTPSMTPVLTPEEEEALNTFDKKAK